MVLYKCFTYLLNTPTKFHSSVTIYTSNCWNWED